MSEIDKEIGELIVGIKKSKTYGEYIKHRDSLSEKPDLKEQVDKYRNEAFELQRSLSPNDPNANARMQEFADRYAEFLDNADVEGFLEAENNLLRMLQELTDRVVESIDFD